MKEIVILSGKGGTGKTTVAASFASLAGNSVIADCDVDAADLHLILRPSIRISNQFFCGHLAEIRGKDCIHCGACLTHCRFEAVIMKGDAAGEAEFSISESACEGCGACVKLCPVKAIDFNERYCGEWYVSGTRFGPMVHAVLAPGAENSGKLVGMVRTKARELAMGSEGKMLITDGPPGIGCPVISSVTGAEEVLLVAEPTPPGIHDLQRAISLARHFDTKIFICVNRFDINIELTENIEKIAAETGSKFAGKIPYDMDVVCANDKGIPVVEHGKSDAGNAIAEIWKYMQANKQ